MSSLSSVVSNLVRASMGSSVSNTVTDGDLDRHVAELILKEARQKAERYEKHGIRAYLPNGGLPESNVPKTNKRFLSTIIRSTDDHNKVILRAQALAAQEIKREREESERRERRLRAEEAAAAERSRRLMGGCKPDSWDRRYRRDVDRKRKERSWSVDEEDDYYTRVGHDDRRSRHGDRQRTRRRRSHSRRHGSRSPSPTKKRATPRDDFGGSRRHCLSPSDPDENQEHARRRKQYVKHKTEDEDSSQARSRRSRSMTRVTPGSESPAPSSRRKPESCAKAGSSSSRIPISPVTHSRSPSPHVIASQLPSKMDKYFEATYDPRLDVTPLSAPSIPASGLIDDAQFDGWDAMLELIRVRREDKEEKKRLEKLGLTKEKLRSKKKNKGESTGITDRWSDVGVSIMDIEYKKKGAVREWDMGKEGF